MRLRTSRDTSCTTKPSSYTPTSQHPCWYVLFHYTALKLTIRSYMISMVITYTIEGSSTMLPSVCLRCVDLADNSLYHGSIPRQGNEGI